MSSDELIFPSYCDVEDRVVRTILILMESKARLYPYARTPENQILLCQFLVLLRSASKFLMDTFIDNPKCSGKVRVKYLMVSKMIESFANLFDGSCPRLINRVFEKEWPEAVRVLTSFRAEIE